jgi:hypothetical protein
MEFRKGRSARRQPKVCAVKAIPHACCWRWQGLASVDELPGQDMGSFVSQRRVPSMWHGRVKAGTSLYTAHDCLRSQVSFGHWRAVTNVLPVSRKWSRFLGMAVNVILIDNPETFCQPSAKESACWPCFAAAAPCRLVFISNLAAPDRSLLWFLMCITPP